MGYMDEGVVDVEDSRVDNIDDEAGGCSGEHREGICEAGGIGDGKGCIDGVGDIEGYMGDRSDGSIAEGGVVHETDIDSTGGDATGGDIGECGRSAEGICAAGGDGERCTSEIGDTIGDTGECSIGKGDDPHERDIDSTGADSSGLDGMTFIEAAASFADDEEVREEGMEGSAVIDVAVVDVDTVVCWIDKESGTEVEDNIDKLVI